jgi:NAD/NADP transhydrogenase alpha subunit
MATTDTPRMVVGVPRENRAGETRVGLTPTALPQLTKAGFDVVIESGAGELAGYQMPASQIAARASAPATTPSRPTCSCR